MFSMTRINNTRSCIYTLQIKIREVNLLLLFFFNIELLSIECILDIPFRITYH